MNQMATRKRLTILCAGLLMIALSTGLVAEETAGTPEKKPMQQMKQGMMEKCRAMMDKHQAMMAESEKADARLLALVEEMDAAKRKGKTAAMAAVVHELVEQRQATKAMMGMGHDMMQHKMAHMQSGMKKDMMAGMGDCPMMKGMPSAGKGESEAREEHTGHHGD